MRNAGTGNRPSNIVWLKCAKREVRKSKVGSIGERCRGFWNGPNTEEVAVEKNPTA